MSRGWVCAIGNSGGSCCPCWCRRRSGWVIGNHWVAHRSVFGAVLRVPRDAARRSEGRCSSFAPCCRMAAITRDPWVFLTAPAHALTGFARGIHVLLWIEMVIACMCSCFHPSPGSGDSGTLCSWFFQRPVASLVLSLELRLVDSVPFTRPFDNSRGATLLPLMFLGGLTMALVVALQHYLLFRSPIAVAGAGMIAAAAAWGSPGSRWQPWRHRCGTTWAFSQRRRETSTKRSSDCGRERDAERPERSGAPHERSGSARYGPATLPPPGPRCG